MAIGNVRQTIAATGDGLLTKYASGSAVAITKARIMAVQAQATAAGGSVANPHTYAPSLVSLSQRVIQQIGRRHASNRQNNLHAHPRLCGDDELQSLHGE